MSTPFGEYLRIGQFNVRAMSEEEMREAIICPAEAVGLEIEAGSWLEERYDSLNLAEQKYIRTSLELQKKEIPLLLGS